VAAPQAQVADLKEIITAVPMSAFDIGSGDHQRAR
jgi:hypothetical protein